MSAAKAPSGKALGWALFDRITAEAGIDSNPWRLDSSGAVVYEPDLTTLCRLLGVPLHLKSTSQSGVPALALDVWLAHELRRAGFDRDAVWPRASEPRVMPAAIAAMRSRGNKGEREAFKERVDRPSVKDVVMSSAHLLGKNYRKQVDVVISDWTTGPELLISTKRMDSSFGKNAANRVEESYGDAKNLRLRHPMAALGFVYGLRSTILAKEGKKADWLIDLLGKLGREEDAYHAVALLLLDYDSPAPAGSDGTEASNTGVVEPEGEEDEELLDLSNAPELDVELDDLPTVRLLETRVPEHLKAATFMKLMVDRILDNTPIDFHEKARARRSAAAFRMV